MQLSEEIIAERKGTTIQKIVKTVAFFAYIYSVTIVGLLSGEVLAILIGFVFVAVSKRGIRIYSSNEGTKAAKKLFGFLIFAFLYSLFALYISNSMNSFDISLPRILIFLFLYGGIAYIVFTNWVYSVEELFSILFLVSIIQAIIIFATILSPSIAEIVDNLPINSSQYFTYSTMRKMGYQSGIACITSTGSLQLSMGLIACVYFILNRSKNGAYIFAFFFLSVIMTTVSRTGLLLAIAALIIIMFSKRSSKKYRVIGVLLLVFFVALIIIPLTNLGGSLSVIFSRLIRTKEIGLYNSFFDGYFQTGSFITERGIPPITWKTILGVGITSGTSGNGVYINADGGFFRLYAALGLPTAIITICYLFFGAIKNTRSIKENSLRIVAIVFVTFLIIGEFKEPFVLSTRYMLIMFLVYLTLLHREQTRYI